MAAGPTPRLHPAQNRGLRECYALTRQLVAHWSKLAARAGPGEATEALEAGATDGRVLLEELTELTADYGLYGFPAAQGVGTRIAGVRNLVADRALERNQALRMAVVDAQYLTTLLAYLGTLGQSGGDEPMRVFCARWDRRLARRASALRRAAVAEGAHPDRAVERIDPGAAGRVGHGLANAVGTAGEWFDRQAARRRGGG